MRSTLQQTKLQGQAQAKEISSRLRPMVFLSNANPIQVQNKGNNSDLHFHF
jgi:hypothetical protein